MREKEREEGKEGFKKGNRKGMQIKPSTYLLMYYTLSLLNKWQDKTRQDETLNYTTVLY